MEEKNKFETALIDVQWDEVVYDSFIFNGDKIVVLKTEQFDEFIEDPELLKRNLDNKPFMLGKIFSKEQNFCTCNYVWVGF